MLEAAPSGAPNHWGAAENCHSCNGGEGWIRTSVRLRGQIYSLLPLTTRPPLHEAPVMSRAFQAGAPCGGTPLLCRRAKEAAARARLIASRALSNATACPQRVGVGAGEGNRTLVVSLEGFCSTIELHPLAGPRCRCDRRASTRRPLDRGQQPGVARDSHDEPDRHRRFFDRSLLVALVDICGAMARLIA